jgi:DNA-binding FrmR family transcriptional regulator
MNKTELRINRIIGQLNGIKKMLKEERDCSAVLMQVSAVKAAVSNLGLELAKSEVCKLSPENKVKLETVLKEVSRM